MRCLALAVKIVWLSCVYMQMGSRHAGNGSGGLHPSRGGALHTLFPPKTFNLPWNSIQDQNENHMQISDRKLNASGGKIPNLVQARSFGPIMHRICLVSIGKI